VLILERSNKIGGIVTNVESGERKLGKRTKYHIRRRTHAVRVFGAYRKNVNI